MKKFNKGFTLLEILLVVGIIAILAGIVIVAINPARQLAQTRNAERRSDLKQLHSAMVQYYIDHGFYPASSTLSITLKEVCDTGSTSSPSGLPCTGLIDLSELVPTYITAIPVDPSGPLASLPFVETAHAAVGGAGYKIGIDSTNKIVATAPQAELNSNISIGTTTTINICDTMCQNLKINLIGYWKMDDSSASTTVIDSVNGNNGTSFRDTSNLTWVGKLGSSLNFNGGSDYINLGNLSSYLSSGTALTIASWVYWDSSGTNDIIISKDTLSGSTRDWLLYLNYYTGSDYGVMFAAWNSSGVYKDAGRSYDPRTLISGWHLVMAGFDGSNIWVSVDNGAKSSTAFSGTLRYNSGTNVYFGWRQPKDAGANLTGKLDNVMMWNRSLNQDELDAIWNSGQGLILQ